MIQSVDSAVQGGDGWSLAPAIHQLPVRPITQNGKHATAVVATATSLANSPGESRFLSNVFCTNLIINKSLIIQTKNERRF